MVATGPPLPDDTLFLAAEFRAGGCSWKSTAKQLGLETVALRRLTRSDEKHWRQLMREAEKTVLRETGYESLLIIRQLMRHKNVKVRRDCSIAYLKAWMAMLRHRPKASRASGTPFDAPWEEDFSYEQLKVFALDGLG